MKLTGIDINRCKQQLGDDIIVNWDDSGVEIYTSNADRPLLNIDEYKPASVVTLGTKRARVGWWCNFAFVSVMNSKQNYTKLQN